MTDQTPTRGSARGRRARRRGDTRIQLFQALIGAVGLSVAAAVPIFLSNRSEETVTSVPPAATTPAPTAPMASATSTPTPGPNPGPPNPGLDSGLRPSGGNGPRPTTPRATGLLTYQIGTFTGPVNLSAEGTADWVHWGYRAADASNPDRFAGGWVADECGGGQCANRKARDQALILDYRMIGGGRPFRLRDRAGPHWSWQGGAPTPTAPDAQGLTYVGETGHGFMIMLSADRTTRVCRLYLGVYQGAATFTARLSDDSAAGIRDTTIHALDVVNTGRDRVIEIRYRAAAPGQTLKLEYVLREDSGGANVAIYAATLR